MFDGKNHEFVGQTYEELSFLDDADFRKEWKKARSATSIMHVYIQY